MLEALRLLGQLTGYFGRVLALETGTFQLILAELALALATGYGTSAVERTAGYFLMAHLALPNVRQTHNYKTVVQQPGVEKAKGFFLVTVLGDGTREDAAYLANEDPRPHRPPVLFVNACI